MYCRNCAHLVDKNYILCPACKAPVYSGASYCQSCSAVTDVSDTVCPKCKAKLTENAHQLNLIGARSRKTAILLGFIFGSVGFHNLYLGYKKQGVIQFLLSVSALFFPLIWFVPFVWSLIETIMISKSPEPLDAQNRKLRV